MNITLTKSQAKAHDIIMDWSRYSGNKLLTLGGYAGTGKTTIIAQIASELKREGKRLAFCTFAGKASLVLKNKLGDVLTEDDYCGTIHSLIYRLIGKKEDEKGKKELIFQAHDGRLKELYDVIIIDEASMVNERAFNDIASHGIPILAVGDHGQLPPVKGSFNLMKNPQIKLQEIVRQAEDNPIIMTATMARNGEEIPYGTNGSVIKTHDGSAVNKHKFENLNNIMICATNRTRCKMNRHARGIFEEDIPQPNEPVICLMNNRKKDIFNGHIGVVQELYDKGAYYDAIINMGRNMFYGNISKKQFYNKDIVDEDFDMHEFDLFDYGYCITAHKSQGSEWSHVTIIQEYMGWMAPEMFNRWLYTAITRAKDTLTIIKR